MHMIDCATGLGTILPGSTLRLAQRGKWPYGVAVHLVRKPPGHISHISWNLIGDIMLSFIIIHTYYCKTYFIISIHTVIITMIFINHIIITAAMNANHITSTKYHTTTITIIVTKLYYCQHSRIIFIQNKQCNIRIRTCHMLLI